MRRRVPPRATAASLKNLNGLRVLVETRYPSLRGCCILQTGKTIIGTSDTFCFKM